MDYREHMVPRGHYRIHAKDYPGEEPAIVLMHGFPDNLHRLMFTQSAGRRVRR